MARRRKRFKKLSILSIVVLFTALLNHVPMMAIENDPTLMPVRQDKKGCA